MKKHKNYVISYHLVAAHVREVALAKGVPFTDLADACGVTLPTMSLLLIGSADLRVSRLYTLADRLGVLEGDLLNGARDWCQRIADEWRESVTILSKFPEVPAPDARIIRAHEINDYVEKRVDWQELFGPGVFRADDLWRRRVQLNLPRAALARKMRVTPGTIQRWEQLKFPLDYWGDEVKKQLGLGVQDKVVPMRRTAS